jgi:chemotaxis protein MotA
MADTARREGLLTLEDVVRDVEDDFLKRGVALAVDGTDPEELREILEAELDAKRAADRQAAKFYNDMGGYAPTIGIIGTVMGLVHVLENLSNPDELGHLIAGAFVATLWGVMSANIVWLPIGSRLGRIGQLESGRMELVIEGVLAVQSGANPRVVAQRLESLMPLSDRLPEAKAAA